jgi:sarcosine oxidase subunit alpha
VTTRLPSPFGSHIDRAKPLCFSFESRRYSAFAGDTVASALIANRVWTFSRSFKYHRPRGPVSLERGEANTLVTVNGVPNVFAESHLLAEGDVVAGQNYIGSLHHDWLGWLRYCGRFLKVGFYYRAFYRPHGAWAFWEPMIRQTAGLGRINTEASHAYYDKAYLFTDVAVVGGGRAGLSAAIAAAENNERVLLIDDGVRLGGSLQYRRDAGEIDTEIARLAAFSTVTILDNARCEGLFSDGWLAVVKGTRLYKARAKQVVLATGAICLPAVFRCNDLPGIVLGTAAQRLIRMYGVRPGNRAVVLTANDAGYDVALDLADAGVEVAAVVDMRASPDGANLLHGRRIRVIGGSEIFAAAGSRHVTAVDIVATGSRDARERIACDLVCISVGTAPAIALAAHAGAAIEYDGANAQHLARSLPAHIRLAGSAAGGAEASHPFPIVAHPKGKEFVDFDEDITVADITDSIGAGFDDIQLLKRYSTIGMGPSQGRHSNVNSIRVAARARDLAPEEIGTTTFRPPWTGESFGVLAGRSFDPVRRTPMHRRHLELGAHMMVAGAWLRPGYYGPPADTTRAIAAEVTGVRHGVGVIDVSTLGKIEIRGPQAAEFLNRLYVTGHVKQPVGRARYALMTDATGTIVDDGVIARFAERHFFVTATTTGVEGVLRSMYFWNTQWQLDVDITNVSAAYGALNIAGPQSRELMALLTSNMALDSEAFPYMAVRVGSVASIPARVMRVGFVGELGYEVHVPFSFGEALWDAILQTGQNFGVIPFGLEAQRILRLEKGHVIVGQDTDGLTHPHEIGMSPAASKPYFIGKPAIAAHNARGLQRRLVGFRIAGTGGDSVQEAHLIIENNEIAGRVTSCAYSAALHATVGLAYVRPHQAPPNTTIEIRGNGGKMIAAQVVTLPFYDPGNERQAR